CGSGLTLDTGGIVLTGKLVRVRYPRDRIAPCYLDTDDATWLDVAGRLRELFAAHAGRTRGELDEELREALGDDPSHLVHRGLAKLLEDRCDFEVAAGLPPDRLREAAFRAAAEQRRTAAVTQGFDRAAALDR